MSRITGEAETRVTFLLCMVLDVEEYFMWVAGLIWKRSWNRLLEYERVVVKDLGKEDT